MRHTTALFLISALATAGIAQADTTATVPDATQKAVTALYQTSCTAAMDPTDKNLDTAFAMLSPDFVSIDPKGKEHKRDEVVATGRMQLKQLEADACNNSFDSMTQPDPNTLVIVATMHLTGNVQEQDGKHAIDVTNKSSDTWKLVNGGWLESQSKDLHTLVKVDGTVVQDAGN